MLTVITGKARSGKTRLVIERIREDVLAGRGGNMLIVPEQYSHEAERELCTACGDSMSLYAEVFSFTGLARRIEALQGGGADKYLDKGGRLLCMAQALSGISAHLTVYANAAAKAETQIMLIAALDELRSAGIGSEALSSAAASCDGALAAKLRDLALILAAYDAQTANGAADPSDRLTRLAAQIPESSLGAENRVYIDGFTDFTFQEKRVISELLRKGVDMTVCLTVDDPNGKNEIFELSRRAMRSLMAEAEKAGVPCRTEAVEREGDTPLAVYADSMFSCEEVRFDDPEGAVSLYAAGSVNDECELAAAKLLSLVRDGGCRWRELAVAVRNFEEYRAALESACRLYGVPLFCAKRSDILSKPLPAMLCLLYDIVTSGWETDDVCCYMRCGLAGLGTAECDELENYIFKWQLWGSAWKRPGDWRQHPDGYGNKYDEAAEEKLARVNALRRRLAAPILAFEERSALAHTAAEHAGALAAYFEDIRLTERLSERAEELEAGGMLALADEYSQLWRIITSALEQCEAVLGDAEMSCEAFGRLFARMLACYDVGTIPVALDRVSAGDFDRMRRRSIKHLIVLGASDSRLPRPSEPSGVFSDDERRRLHELDIELAGGDGELWREFTLIYNCLTLPSESLTLCFSRLDADGNECRPSVLMKRAEAIFSSPLRRADMDDVRMSAPAPALGLAALAYNGSGRAALAAREYFSAAAPERLASVEAASRLTRGRLSPASVEALYGKKLRISATRADKFASCRFAYFCQFGLSAKPYRPEGFKPPEIGTFMHYVLEKVAGEVRSLGGFRCVDDGTLGELTDKWINEYVSTELNDFQEKSARFIFLFKRICADTRAVVADMANELRQSDFEPLSFELNFAKAQDVRPIELDGGDTVSLSGIADRVDGWLHEGRLYLRVVDYKTGKKDFSLENIWRGMDMQMLLYLLALDDCGMRLYDETGARETVPAGVMYVPAIVKIIPADGTETDGDIEKKRAREVRRKGLLLEDAALAEAWEHGEDKRYIPLKTRGKSANMASAERFGLLFKRIKRNLSSMAHELREGSIAADPYFRSQEETACTRCDFADVCHFSHGENGEECRVWPKLKPEKVWEMLEGGENDG